MSATETSKKTNVSVRTVNNIYIRIRENIAENSLDEIKNIAIDPSEYYFGFKKNNGLVFVILKTHNSIIVAKSLDKNEIKTLSYIFNIKEDLAAKVDIIKEKILNGEKVTGYYGVVDLNYKVSTLITQNRKMGIVQFRKETKIRSFLIYSRRKIFQTKGICGHAFETHLKAAAFLFNHSTPSITYQKILKNLRLKNEVE